MKLILTVAVLFPLANALEFDEWKVQFEKSYKDADTEVGARKTFEENAKFIEEENKKGHLYTLAHNMFSDLTSEEFAKFYLGLKTTVRPYNSTRYLGRHTWEGEELAAEVDWTSKGAVTDVKNQGQCGSCWSFSTTGALEGANFIASGKLVSLSEQQFVDCDTTDSGCNGGLMDHAFAYAKDNNICTETSYPYTGVGGTCQTDSCTMGLDSTKYMTGYHDVSQDENSLMAAIQQQPVSVAIEADQMAFQLYSSGVMSGTCGTNLDHGVLAVGYGTDSGVDYWKIKNSWSSTWGMDGYILIARGSDECGILMGPPSYPIITSYTSIVV